jgi:multicomponent Na+:H+ antiporter subunit E
MSLRSLRSRVPWGTIVWLTLVWVMLWGDLSVATFLVGALIALALTIVLPLPVVAFESRVHPLALARLVGRFVLDLLRASFQVALLALRPGTIPHGAVIRVHLRSESDVYLTLTAELTTLVPGSLVVEAHRQTGVLYLHLLDVETLGGVEKVRADTLEVEARILRALATDSELEAAGLSRSPRRHGSGPR